MVLQFHHFERFTVATITWLTIIEYLWHYRARIFTICRNHSPILSTFMTFPRSNMMVAKCTKNCIPIRSTEFTPGFWWSCALLNRLLFFICSGLYMYINLCPLSFFFFWLLYYLYFFELRFLITFLVFSNFY